MGKNKRRGKKRAKRKASRRRPDASQDRRFVDVAIIAMLLLAGYFAVFGGEYSAFDVRRLQKTESRATTDLAATQATIDSLQTLADEIQSDPDAIERVAREKYGMIKDGEILYRFNTASDSTDTTATAPPKG